MHNKTGRFVEYSCMNFWTHVQITSIHIFLCLLYISYDTIICGNEIHPLDQAAN